MTHHHIDGRNQVAIQGSDGKMTGSISVGAITGPADAIARIQGILRPDGDRDHEWEVGDLERIAAVLDEYEATTDDDWGNPDACSECGDDLDEQRWGNVCGPCADNAGDMPPTCDICGILEEERTDLEWDGDQGIHAACRDGEGIYINAYDLTNRDGTINLRPEQARALASLKDADVHISEPANPNEPHSTEESIEDPQAWLADSIARGEVSAVAFLEDRVAIHRTDGSLAVIEHENAW